MMRRQKATLHRRGVSGHKDLRPLSIRMVRRVRQRRRDNFINRCEPFKGQDKTSPPLIFIGWPRHGGVLPACRPGLSDRIKCESCPGTGRKVFNYFCGLKMHPAILWAPVKAKDTAQDKGANRKHPDFYQRLAIVVCYPCWAYCIHLKEKCNNMLFRPGRQDFCRLFFSNSRFPGLPVSRFSGSIVNGKRL